MDLNRKPEPSVNARENDIASSYRADLERMLACMEKIRQEVEAGLGGEEQKEEEE